MSVVTMSQTLMIGSFGMTQVSYDMVETSDPTGSEAVRLFGPPRWKVNMGSSPDMTLAQASEWEVLVLALRRGINHLAVWDPVRVAPQGTMRGFLTLGVAAVAGTVILTLVGASGTLKPGDWLQIGTGVGASQLVKCMANVTASANSASVVFEPPLRAGFAAGTVVTWDHPVFYAKSIAKAVKWEYQAGNLLQGGFALDLLESFNL